MPVWRGAPTGALSGVKKNAVILSAGFSTPHREHRGIDRRVGRRDRRTSFTLPLAWLAGSLFGLTAAATTGSAVSSSFWFLLLGGLVIADAKLSLSMMTALAALLGLVHGYLNGTGWASRRSRWSPFLD